MPSTDSTLNISFFPTAQHLALIANWIQEENAVPLDQISNWKAIESSFKRHELVVALIKNYPVGFFALLKGGDSILIMVAEVRRAYRKCGIGRKILNAVIESVKDENVLQLELMCEPPSSEIIWKKMGFDVMPTSALYSNSSIMLHLAI